MLTPDKIKEKQFQSSGRGSYRADDVDVFMNEVLASYEQMFKENGDLIRKISILAKKVEEYRADEESLKLALLNAQKLADQIVAEAKEKAEKESTEALAAAEKKVADAKAEAEELSVNSKRESAAIIESAKSEAERIIGEANKKSDDILGNINRKVTHETLVFDMTKKEAAEFKSRLVAMYKEHINLINQLPDIVDEQLDTVSPAPVSEPETPAEEETEETAVTEKIPAEPVAAEEVQEAVAESEEEIAVNEEAEPVFEDIYSDSADSAETNSSEKVVKEENPFKLDLSKIDFSDDDEEEELESASEPVPAEEVSAEEETDEDDGAAPVSFKNFFKRK